MEWEGGTKGGTDEVRRNQMEWGGGIDDMGRRNQMEWGGGIDDMGRREEWGGEIGVRGKVREKG